MLDAEIVDAATRFIMQDLADKEQFLCRDYGEVLREMEARNMLHSTITIDRINELCAESIRCRMKDSWRILSVFLAEAGIGYSDDLEAQLIKILEELLNGDFADIKEIYEKTASMVHPAEPAIKQFEAKLGQVSFTEFNALRREVADFVRRLKGGPGAIPPARVERKLVEPLPQPPIRWAGMAMDLQDDLKNVLFSMEFGINSTSDPMLPKAELIELVRDIRSEMDKPEPDYVRLQRLLSAMGTSIRKAPALLETYEDLRDLLTGMGTVLP